MHYCPFIMIGRYSDTDRENHRLGRAFTLIELLVVISIISLLMGILMPALARSRQKARSISCSSRMRQIGMASQVYAQENENQFARSSHSAAVYRCQRWGQAFMPYLGSGPFKDPNSTAWKSLFCKFYRCPSDKRTDKQWSYGKNVWFELKSTETAQALGLTSDGPTYSTTTQVRHPAATVEFGELLESNMADHIMAHFWLQGGDPEVDMKRHGNLSNYSFVDNHVESKVFDDTFKISAPNKIIDNWNPGTAR
jgi:prepilin-type N-terminal cleavage/methylation domain-containing protein/prepilin-type processing-associated H-X9-DG protein